MTQTTPDEEFTEETGLNLFDDRASAAGSFPHAMLGYDRATVDSYVREIEQQVSTLRQLARHLRQELATAQQVSGDTDYTRLGAHAAAMLRAAEAQAQDLVSKAGVEAERVKEEGRRVAADLRASAQTEADDIRVATLSSLRAMREQLDRECDEAREATKKDAQTVIDAAQTQAQTLLEETKQNNAAAATQAQAAARQVTDQAAAQAEQTRAKAREEAHRLVDEAKSESQRFAGEIETLMAQAKQQAAEAAEHIAKATEQAARIRSESMAAAEQVRAQAARESEAQIAAAHRQATMMKDRLEEQFGWRKEQIEREVAALLQRKDAIVAQMGNLRQLAESATTDYPDTDPFANDSDKDPEPAEGPQADAQWLASGSATEAAPANEPTTVLASPDLDPDPTAVIARVESDRKATATDRGSSMTNDQSR